MFTPFQHLLATHAAGKILGYRKDGRPIYPIAGGSGAGEGGSGGNPPAPAPPAANPPAPVAPAPPAPPVPQPPTPPAAPPGAPPEGDVKSLPDWAQKMISDARAEAGKERTTAKANAANEAREQLLKEFGEKLGILTPEAKPDPAALTAAIGEKDTTIATLTTSNRELSVQLALYDHADKHGANPTALRDSVSFMKSLAGLDPTAADFGTKLDDAIKTAVEANQQLRMVPGAPRRGGGEFNGAPGATGRPTSLGQAVAAGLSG